MRVLSLELTDVRHFARKRLEFHPGFNLLVGENGAGKSTVLRSLLTALGRGDKAGAAQITHRWRQSTKRKGRIARSPVLWFGSNEAAARTLQGQRVRHYRSGKNDKWRRDDFWHREDFLHREEFMEPPDEEEHAPFGRSEHVRRFVGKVLRQFSPKFERFVWRFLPYDCVVQIPESMFQADGPASEFRAEVRAEIMRYLDDDFPPRRYYRGWGSQRAITFKANGEPADGRKRVRPMPEFAEIVRSVSRRFKSAEAFEAVTIQIKLAPRISVLGPDGPFLLSQLSDGEKRIFSMLVDIARQLSLLPGGWREIASAAGLVVIDEIDCHLHPKWQRMIVSALEELFPACQFIGQHAFTVCRPGRRRSSAPKLGIGDPAGFHGSGHRGNCLQGHAHRESSSQPALPPTPRCSEGVLHHSRTSPGCGRRAAGGVEGEAAAVVRPLRP
jgi:energy-coupling factor transporter ATP-binding protein EcfA2